ncbi:hypothetical protein AB0C29_30310 [Actinoplanes sp. NPDC048791]
MALVSTRLPRARAAAARHPQAMEALLGVLVRPGPPRKMPPAR